MEKISSQKFSIKKRPFNLKNANKALLLAIIILGVYYVAGTNDLTVKGFALSDLKAQKNKLIEANNKLELNILALSSYSNIKEKVGNLKMVAAGEISYLTAGSEAVAKK
ncbi:hypothetical protein HY797_00345 [Candidatus Falkowbacteria bacterium]|nr:hypothetical protein [Candidatus Falkowbacteria bacterium]